MPYLPPKNEPLPESGTLQDLPLGHVLYRAARERKSGVLTVTDERVEKSFHFLKGHVIGSSSSLPAESLARLTVLRGKATRETVEGLGVPLLNDHEVRAALQAKAGLGNDEVEELQRFVLLYRLSDVFARPNMRFQWSAPVPVDGPTQINPFQMFSEGVAKRLGREQLDAAVRDLLDEKPRGAKASVFAIDGGTLPPRAAQLYRRIDGRTTFQELVEGANRTVAPAQVADSTYRSWVYLLALLEGGFIEVGAATDSVSASPFADEPVAPDRGEGETVMVVTSAGGSAVAYREVEDPALSARFQAMQQQSLLELLGINESATDAQVKKAYFKLAKEFHPDKLYNHQERTVKKYADRAFGLVNKAYEQLKSAEGRKEYLQRQKELAEGIDLDKEAQTLLQSEVEFQKGLVLLRKKDFAGAAGQFRTALELNPRESDHFAYCGWAEFQVAYPADEFGWKNAVAKLKKALELNPKAHDAMFFLGQAAKLEGDLETAEKMFNGVLKHRPNHVEAQRELRLMQQRREKEPPASNSKKMIDKLFK